MRLFHYATPNGKREYVIFVEDEDATTEEHCIPGFEISSVTKIEQELPCTLPIEYTLMRQ